MPYVLKRNPEPGHGGRLAPYVARPGSARSYVRDLAAARLFATREEAEAEACGNESAVQV